MRLVVMMAMTVDGKIGVSADHFPDWTGSADKLLFKEITMKAGALIMGYKTFKIIGKPLPGRKNIVMTRNPTRHSHWDNLFFSSEPPEEILDNLKKEGFMEVVLAGGAKVNTLFAKAGLINDIIVTYVPKIFGQGLSLFSEPLSMDLKLNEFKVLDGGRIFAHYQVFSSNLK
jgi:dihydrofolate reductase